MANTPDKSQMSDDERAELRAMIAAGRDLSPEMDESLVDSYAERRAAEQRAKEKVQGKGNAVVPQQQSGSVAAGTNPAVAIAGMVMVAAIFVTIMVVSGGAYWWMIFPLIGIGGGWWGNHDRHRLRDERRAQRYQMRADYYRTRMGYPSEQDAHSLPASTRSDSGPLPPPTSAPTQTPPPTRSVPPTSGASGEQPPTNPAG